MGLENRPRTGLIYNTDVKNHQMAIICCCEHLLTPFGAKFLLLCASQCQIHFTMFKELHYVS